MDYDVLNFIDSIIFTTSKYYRLLINSVCLSDCLKPLFSNSSQATPIKIAIPAKTEIITQRFGELISASAPPDLAEGTRGLDHFC
jgi:hypothetical protein